MSDLSGVAVGALVTLLAVVITPLARVLATGVEERMKRRSERRARVADLVVAWEDFGQHWFGFDGGVHRKYERSYLEARSRVVETLGSREVMVAYFLADIMRAAKEAELAEEFRAIIRFGRERIEGWASGQISSQRIGRFRAGSSTTLEDRFWVPELS